MSGAAALRRLVCSLFMAAVFAAAQRPAPTGFEANGEKLWVTPTIMSGFLFGLLWLTFFFTGFCCLFQVQTPSSYEEKVVISSRSAVFLRRFARGTSKPGRRE